MIPLPYHNKSATTLFIQEVVLQNITQTYSQRLCFQFAFVSSFGEIVSFLVPGNSLSASLGGLFDAVSMISALAAPLQSTVESHTEIVYANPFPSTIPICMVSPLEGILKKEISACLTLGL